MPILNPNTKRNLNLTFSSISDPGDSQLEILNVFITFMVVFCRVGIISIPALYIAFRKCMEGLNLFISPIKLTLIPIKKGL